MQIQCDLCNYSSVIKMMYLVNIDLKVVQFILKLGTYYNNNKVEPKKASFMLFCLYQNNISNIPYNSDNNPWGLFSGGGA